MKKIILLFSIIFVILTFLGSGYVLLSKGQANAGYSGVPMVFAIASLTLYRNLKEK